MVAPTYTTDLTDINLVETAGGTTGWSATGGGASALGSETDYYIQGDGCISKGGFTADTKGMIYNAGATTITSGDCLFIWSKQNNRNLLDTVALGGVQVLIGSNSNAYDQFYVDGNDSEGSDLAGWRVYAVDPTATPSATTGSPSGTSWFGVQWKILGSGSLKGSPNGIDAFRHGREIRCQDGDGTNGYATFTGAGDFDANITRRWGILTPTTGALQFHGAFVMGLAGTAVDFRDEAVNIVVLDDPFAPSTFNEFLIRNASSNVEWTSITISHLGTTAPSILTLDTGTFTGESNRFDGCATTTFNTNGSSSCINTTWVNSGRINLNQADISGSSILTPNITADEGAVFDDRTSSGAFNQSETNNCTFTKSSTVDHHAIRFGANVTDDITLTGVNFNSFSATDSVNASTLRFDATTGSINVNLVGCSVDGASATTSNIGVDSAGITVTLVVDPVTQLVNVKDTSGNNLQDVRVLVEVAETISGGEIYEATVSSLVSSAGTATCTMASAHGLVTGDKVVVRGAQPDDYNRVATVTVSSSTIFTYTVPVGISSPATGTPVVTYAVLSGLTNASGNIQASRTWGANQAVTGKARKSTTSPFFKQGLISYTVDSSNGNTTNVVLQPDE